MKNARRLAAVSDAARAAGLSEGQTLADALALEPGLHTEDADPDADLAALEALADWCVRFSPAVAVDAPDGLILDVDGAGGLWGGEQGLLDDLVSRLARAGIPARAAIADTIGGAWAFARYGADRMVVPGEATQALLAPMPIEGLRLEPAAADALIVLGLVTVGALAATPRAELSRRFGPLTRLRLDQALGHAEEALVFRRPPPPFFERLAFFEPISAPEDLARVSLDIVSAICARLTEARSGARRFELGFHRLDGRVEGLRVGTALPNRDARRIAKLLAPKLERVDPGFGVEAVTLRADHVEHVAERQEEIAAAWERPGPPSREASNTLAECPRPAWDDPRIVPFERTPSTARDAAPTHAPTHTPHAEGPAPRDLNEPPEILVDQLANRLGETRVWRPSSHESWLPERAVTRLAPLAVAERAWPPDRPRPVRLFRRPEPIKAFAKVPDDPPRSFEWRGQTHQVRRAEGPERLAQEWWRASLADIAVEKVRDYYRIEDAEGRRFWIFRAGLYVPDATVRWWLHGLFA